MERQSVENRSFSGPHSDSVKEPSSMPTAQQLTEILNFFRDSPEEFLKIIGTVSTEAAHELRASIEAGPSGAGTKNNAMSESDTDKTSLDSMIIDPVDVAVTDNTSELNDTDVGEGMNVNPNDYAQATKSGKRKAPVCASTPSNKKSHSEQSPHRRSGRASRIAQENDGGDKTAESVQPIQLSLCEGRWLQHKQASSPQVGGV